MSEHDPDAIAKKFFVYTMVGTAIYIGVVCGFVFFQ